MAKKTLGPDQRMNKNAGDPKAPAAAVPASASSIQAQKPPVQPIIKTPEASLQKPAMPQAASVAFQEKKAAQAATENAIPQLRQNLSQRQNDNAKRLMAGAIIEPPKLKNDQASWPFWTGLGLTAAWFAVVFFVGLDVHAAGAMAGLSLSSVALGMSGVIAPVAFLWMIIAYLQRAADVRAVTEPLRRQLQMILGTGTQAESRVRRFNEALERQLELLRHAGDGSYDVLQSAIQALHEEEKAIAGLADRSGKEIQRVAGIVRDNSEVLEDLLHDNRERFSDLSGRIAGHIATLDQHADEAAGRMGEMVERLYSVIDQFKAAADKKLLDCAALADQIGQQEKATEESSRRMNDTLMAARLGAQELNNVLAKNHDLLDGSGARLAERMAVVTQQIETFTQNTDAKEQKLAEKSQLLSDTLAREIGALEALTGRLESQIIAANEGLGARTAELQESQEKLALNAGGIIQNVQKTTKALDETAQAAVEKFSGLHTTLSNQANMVIDQFQLSSQHYEDMAGRLSDVSHNVATRVATIGEQLSGQVETIDAVTGRAVAAAVSAQDGVSGIVKHLDGVIAKIGAVEGAAKNSADLVKGHIDNLGMVQEGFVDVTGKLSERARAAEASWQALVHTAHTQQTALQSQLQEKVQDALALLGEQAHAMEATRDHIYLNIEAGLARSDELMARLETFGASAREPFDAAVERVRQAVEQGQGDITRFVDTLHKSAETVGHLNLAMAAHSDQAGHKAAEMLAGLDAVSARAQAVQHSNMQAAHDVALRLNTLVDHIETRMGDVSGTAAAEQRKLADVVRQLSFDMHGLIHDSQTAEQRVRLAASLLSEQAADVRGKLEAQAQAIQAISSNYSSLTALNENGLEQKIDYLDRVVRGATGTLQDLGSVLDDRAGQVARIDVQLKDSANILDNAAQLAVDRLSIFNHAMVATQTRVGETSQEVFARLSDMNEQFNRQVSSVGEGSQLISKAMRQTVGDLVEQSVGLAAASQQAEQRIATLAAETASLHHEAQKTRSAIEAEAKAMQARLTEVLAQIESASVGMERNAVIAFDRTEGMASRFEKLNTAAFNSLGHAAEKIEKIADASILKVEDVNKALTGQVAALTFAGEHLAEVEGELRRSTQINTEHLNRLAREVNGTAAHAADQLCLQVAGLKAEAEGMLSRFDLLGRGLANQSLGVMNVTEALERNLWKMRETALAAHEDTSAMRQAIAADTAEFRTEVQLATREIGSAGDILQQRGDLAATIMHQLAGRFIEATQSLQISVEEQTARLGTVADTAQAKLDVFSAKLGKSTSELNGAADTLGSSGAQITETLEKANFLLRNVGGQIERMKANAQEVSGALLQRLSEMLCTFEDELKGMTGHAGLSLEELNSKARGMSAQLREEAEAAANNVVIVLHGLKTEVAASFDEVAAKASQAVNQLRDEGGVMASSVKVATALALNETREHMANIRSSLEGEMADMTGALTDAVEKLKNQLTPLAATVRHETDQAFMGAAAHVEDLQHDFKNGLVAMAEALLGHLRQVQDSGARVVDTIRSGAHAGAAEAVQVLSNLREAAADEVKGMVSVVEAASRELQRAGERVRLELRDSSDDTQREALASFVMMREQMESEMRSLVAKAGGALSQLQDTCDQLTRSMERAVDEAAQTGSEFKQVAGSMQDETHKMSSAVLEAGQHLASTQNALIKSQDTILGVAQKSQEAMARFNGSMVEAQGLQGALQQSLGDLLGRLTDGLTTLNQHINSVKGETQNAVQSLGGSAQQVANQNHGMISTVQALAAAIGQLEAVNQSLNKTMQTNVQDAAQQAQQLEAQARKLQLVGEATSQWMGGLTQQVDGQVQTLEHAAQAVAQQTGLVSRALAVPVEEIDRLNQHLDRTLDLTARVGEKVSSQFGDILRNMEKNLHSLADVRPVAAPVYVSPPEADASAALQRLRGLAQPPASQTFAKPAYVKPAAVTPAPVTPTPVKTESQLISSLSDIINQLQATAGEADAKLKKHGS